MNVNQINKDACLFSKKEMYLASCLENGKLPETVRMCKRAKRKAVYANMHLAIGMNFTKKNGFPILEPHTGSVDFTLVPFTMRNRYDGANQALMFFLNDDTFYNQIWFNLERVTYNIRKYDYFLTPDFTLWKRLPTEHYNKESIFMTRFVGAFWQQCGFSVIPTASWGGLTSFDYCFEGLPMHSVIAVTGMGIHKTTEAFNLFCYGLRRLEEE